MALDGSVYVIGGLDAAGRGVSTVEVFDPTSGQWSRAADTPVPLHHPNVAAVDGRIFVLGFLKEGFAADGRTFVYDPSANAWEERQSMPAGGERGAAGVAVVDGRVYVVGGFRSGSVADFSAYDPAADTWTPLPPLPEARDHLAAGALDGMLYALSGRRDGNLPDVHAFDVASNTWSERAPIPTARSGIAGAVAEGWIYVFGGEGNPARPDGVFAEVEVYDPAADRWQSLPPMPVPRHGIGAAVVDGWVYIPGGGTVQGLGAVAHADAFHP